MILNIFKSFMLFIVYTFQGPCLYLTKTELMRERKTVIDTARAIHEKAEGENRPLTDEESTQYDALMDKQDEFQARAERMDKQDAIDRTLADGLGPDAPSAIVLPTSPKNIVRASEGYGTAFNRLLRTGPAGLSAEHQKVLAALQADDDIAGGFTVTPEQFVATLIKAIDDSLYIRQRANVIPVDKAGSLGAPSLDADPEDGTWSGEITAADEDTQMATGKRVLSPHLLVKLVKISEKLVRVSAIDIASLVINRLAYKFGVTMEKAYLVGSGASQPLGVFTASADGISTGRDVATNNTDTQIRLDGLIDAKFSLKQGYLANADWIFHRDGVKQISKLKDGNGQYLWRESVRVGEPDTLLSRPVLVSEYAPNTFTTGLYVGLLGDFSYYWIADAMDFAVQVLMELYAATNQNGYIGRYEGDGMPVLEEAFARVTLA